MGLCVSDEHYIEEINNLNQKYNKLEHEYNKLKLDFAHANDQLKYVTDNSNEMSKKELLDQHNQDMCRKINEEWNQKCAGSGVKHCVSKYLLDYKSGDDLYKGLPLMHMRSTNLHDFVFTGKILPINNKTQLLITDNFLKENFYPCSRIYGILNNGKYIRIYAGNYLFYMGFGEYKLKYKENNVWKKESIEYIGVL